MDFALAMTDAYVHMPHAWITVIVPGLLSMLAIVLLRRTWTSFSCSVLFAAGTAVTWLTARWTDTPTHLGLHLQPAAFLLLLFAWRDSIARASSLAQAARWAACLAGLTWLSLVAVDVGACMSRENCSLMSTGGAGSLDMLVLGPMMAICAVMTIWIAHQTRRQPAVA